MDSNDKIYERLKLLSNKLVANKESFYEFVEKCKKSKSDDVMLNNIYLYIQNHHINLIYIVKIKSTYSCEVINFPIRSSYKSGHSGWSLTIGKYFLISDNDLVCI